MEKPLLVTAAILREGTRILIARRKLTASNGAGQWEFPGGKVEFLESPEESLVREIQEELDLEIEVGEIFAVTSHVYANRVHVVLLCYSARVIGGRLRAVDVEEARWVEPAELSGYDFAAADIPIVEKLKSAADLRRV